MTWSTTPLPLKEPPGVLGEIIASKVATVGRLQPHRPTRRPDAPRGFSGQLRGGRAGTPKLIAEIKPKSPSRGHLAAPDHGALCERATRYDRYAAAISVLCDEAWFGGSLTLLQAVRSKVSCPVLCKDFIVAPAQIALAASAGADAVLLMASVLRAESLRELLQICDELGVEALVETHDDDELQEAVEAGSRIIGVNSRDLRTLEIDLQRAVRLLHRAPSDSVLVAESGIRAAADLARFVGTADAALVGTSLMLATDVTAAIEHLGFKSC